MKLEILSFTWKLFRSETVEQVTAMTKIGEITILDNHSPLVTALKPSIISITYLEDSWLKCKKFFAIWGWILEVSNSEVKVLIDMLISIDDVDVDHAEKARLNALELMEKYKWAKDKVDMETFLAAEDMLLKSVAQLKLSNLNK